LTQSAVIGKIFKYLNGSICYNTATNPNNDNNNNNNNNNSGDDDDYMYMQQFRRDVKTSCCPVYIAIRAAR